MSLKGVVKRGLQWIIKGVPNYSIDVNISYLSPNERLKGKNIIITGGGRGLGFAMAKKFIAEGANVIIVGRNEQTLRSSAEELKCNYLQLDVQQANSFESFFQKAEALLGPIDCFVNNAGISLHEQSFLDVNIDQFDSQINTNFKGVYFLTQEFVKRYINNGLKSGKVLFISSETSMTVDDRPYGLTKAALNSLVQGLAYRYIKYGIRMNAIAPGVTLSDMIGNKSGNLYAPSQVTSRIYLPEEVAEIAAFLLSEESNLLNGQILVCNEGKTINARWK